MSPEAALPFSGSLTPQDLSDARKTGYRFPRWAKICLIPIGLLVFYTLVIAPILAGATLLSYMPTIAVIGALVAIYLLSVKRAIRKAYDTNRLLHGRFEGEIHENRIAIRSQYGASELPWTVFYRVTQSDNFVLLFVGTSQYYLFPRSFFSRQEDWQEFRRRAAAHVTASEPQSSMPSILRTVFWWVVIFVVVIILWNAFQAS